MNNIVLIGMPGCGKSTVGVVLAKRLGMDFTDSDLLIQKKYKETLSSIIDNKGLKEFLRIEDEVNGEIETDNTVIATGGSVVYGKNAMEHLKSIGTVVYLKLDYNVIKSRLGDLKKRGVAMEKGMSLQDLYTERTPLYEKYADITVECNRKQIRQIVEMLALHFEEQ